MVRTTGMACTDHSCCISAPQTSWHSISFHTESDAAEKAFTQVSCHGLIIQGDMWQTISFGNV